MGTQSQISVAQSERNRRVPENAAKAQRRQQHHQTETSRGGGLWAFRYAGKGGWELREVWVHFKERKSETKAEERTLQLLPNRKAAGPSSEHLSAGVPLPALLG